MTTVGDAFGSPEFSTEVAEWLNKHQPISLVVNGDYALMRTLWEKSGMVVNTAGLGYEDASAALTAQARSVRPSSRPHIRPSARPSNLINLNLNLNLRTSPGYIQHFVSR